jgi:REP element-mobilizing transposase RayT
MPQSHAAILVHLIFSTKNRQPLIRSEIEPELFPYMAKSCQGANSPALLINGTMDHVHLLVKLGRRTSIADLVEEIKTSSSSWIKTKGAVYQNFYWQLGYGAFSIGQSGVAEVLKYIADQKEHHRGKTFQEEFRGFLRRYEIEYDERYVWD